MAGSPSKACDLPVDPTLTASPITVSEDDIDVEVTAAPTLSARAALARKTAALKTAAILRPRSPDSSKKASKIRTPTIIMFSEGVGEKRKGYFIQIKQNSPM